MLNFRAPNSSSEHSAQPQSSTLWINVLFFCAGFPALIYQIVWERALFAIFGINIQSVTIVVSAFMLGLGLGSLLGGVLSRTRQLPLITLFSAAEFGTAICGLVSLNIFHRIAELATSSSLLKTGVIAFSLVLLPTLFMGLSLPLLVEHFASSSNNLGSIVGDLYFFNTLGSAAACFFSAEWLMRHLGQASSVRLAASINIGVSIGALFYSSQSRRVVPTQPTNTANNSTSPITFPLALACAFFAGFSALSYEIIWYRILAFATRDTAPLFAMLLGTYLCGLALGSRFVARYSQTHSPMQAKTALEKTIFYTTILAFFVGPISAIALEVVFSSRIGNWPAYLFIFLFICLVAGICGAIFPLVAYTSIPPGSGSGRFLSYVYMANIIGSTIGILVVGFILMDYFSLFQISLLLLLTGVLLTILISLSTPRFILKWTSVSLVLAALIGVAASKPIFTTMYDRLFFKTKYPEMHFQQVVENRSGTIGVTPDGTVFGDGVYDGKFSVDLLQDTNIIARPYALSAFTPSLHRVLVIGLGSGSWAQVVVNNPDVEHVTIVEINPGYLGIIPDHAATNSLLQNPKVNIIIDDGRRWLLHNPQERFDAIVMNTTFHWRNHSSNLLSADFFKIARQHLTPDGVLFYNTTGSDDAMATGLSVYQYGLRFMNCMAVSDSPLNMNREKWKAILLSYVIDGKNVINKNNSVEIQKLDQIINIPEDPTGKTLHSIENNSQLRSRLNNHPVITDDNMGDEWVLR